MSIHDEIAFSKHQEKKILRPSKPSPSVSVKKKITDSSKAIKSKIVSFGKNERRVNPKEPKVSDLGNGDQDIFHRDPD